MRAVQLKCYYTGKPAPEVDRARIQSRIDRYQEELEDLAPDSAKASGIRWSIMALKGNIRMPRG